MSKNAKEAPEFTRDLLVELAGARTCRDAEQLYAAGRVHSAEWQSPVLVGRVRTGGELYEPRLNLRSTVFAENACRCREGRRGLVCAHAVAAALRFQAARRETASAVEARAETSVDGPEPEERVESMAPEKEERAEPASLCVSGDGEPLRVLLYLPPNLEDAAGRDAVMVKLEAACGREILPLGQVSPTRPVAPTSAAREVLMLVESWCGGKTASLLELSVARLRRLLEVLSGEPLVYWVKRPNEPIEWTDGQLRGVHEVLPEAPVSRDNAEMDRPPSAGASEAERETAIPDTVEVNPRASVSVNRRRAVESGAFRNWKPQAGDYPTAATGTGSMEGMSDHRVVVDGSPNFLAIRLPSGRDAELRPLRELLKSSGFQLDPRNRKWWLRDRHKTLNFLAANWRALRDEWRAAFTENFEKKCACVQLSELDVRAREEGDHFTLDVRLSENADESSLRRAIAGGKQYVESEDERITLLDQDSVQRLHEIERAVSGQADRPFTPSFSKRLNAPELADVEGVLEEMAEGWQPPQAWQARSRALKEVGALEPAPVRPGLDAGLRTYQRIGVAWLRHLYRNNLGGVLADEMGLGKTIMALALIECIRKEQRANEPALVVGPASLVENWAREAQRFTPGLKVARHHGPGRPREPAALEDTDIVITSYGTLRQDAELLATLDWSVVIGDEAQHIKNRRTQNARSLLRMRGKGRFLLTGTPVENSLEDLLSLFAFLMPGYLEKAPPNLSVEDRNWHTKRQTGRAAPYILRRTKKEVAPELPDKIEKTWYCEFGARQKQFYQETLERTRKQLFELEMAGANERRVRFAAFTELLRLRQACVDPRITEENFPAAESAKLSAFEELLDECLDTGSRMLVFSSFVSALKLLAERLEEKGHRYCYLDGQTRNRLSVCDTFNQDPAIPVFLVSLKAGGTGLNLTGADTVVHYDPWWNPAAEAQATDRTHRIGQKRVVTSIKLIAADTVEEKVLEMQREKAGLLTELFEASEAANAKVSLDEIKELLE
ncbi:MAG: SNF2-related protein [Opitutales bacterium]